MMKRTRSWSISLMAVLALFLLLAGCMGRRYVEKRTFLLDVSRDGTVSTAERNVVLRVRTLRVSPRYEGKGFVYRMANFNYESDFYNEFFTSPDSMITEEVRQWLAESGLFQQVVDFSSPVNPTHILEGTVMNLYGDFSEGSQPGAVLGIQFSLIDDIAGRSEIVLQKSYRREVPIQGMPPAALVEAWNEALRKVLIDLEKDLKALDLRTAGS